jgi:hypothetical protein
MLAGESRGMNVSYWMPSDADADADANEPLPAQVEQHQHVIFAPVISADTPARSKYGGFLSVTAFLACFRCLFEGHKFEKPARQGTYFLGYNKPSPQTLTVGGAMVNAWDAVQKDDTFHRGCCKLAEGGWACKTDLYLFSE